MDFPTGATAGKGLHPLFEELDFAAATPAAIEPAASAALQAYNFDLRWLPTVGTMVKRTLATTLQTPEGGSFSLNQITGTQRLTEMQFFLPLGAIESNSLAKIFVRHSIDTGPTSGFAEHLRELGFGRHHGMLQGFIDLVFRHEERYYLLDWKSNHLGTHPGDYQPEALTRAMQASYYTLQYHLYLVALHRHLRSTLPGYRYETHFGGVVYAYLRGTSLNADSGSTLGMYRDYPDRALIESLADYLASGEEAA
jgi:exodeoxyribonuclease V beta subunit